jgi:hypothetical protein
MMTKRKDRPRVLALRFRPGARRRRVHAAAETIAIATGGTGGVYYPLGGGMANVLSKYVPGVQATAEVTGGSVDNLKLIGTGRARSRFTMADAALDALKGEDKFKGNKVRVRTLMVLYPNRMHVVTIEGTGIEKMADLKGKRVSTGSPGSATEVMAFRVIEAAGLDKDKDMKRERLGVAESVNALKDRKIDAFFWVGGLPTAAVTDLAQHARHEDQDDRPRRRGREDERQIRQALHLKRHVEAFRDRGSSEPRPELMMMQPRTLLRGVVAGPNRIAAGTEERIGVRRLGFGGVERVIGIGLEDAGLLGAAAVGLHVDHFLVVPRQRQRDLAAEIFRGLDVEEIGVGFAGRGVELAGA